VPPGKTHAGGRAAVSAMLLTACLLGTGMVVPAGASAPAGGPTPSLDLRTAPLVDLYFTVRALAAGDSAAPEALAGAVNAARSVAAALPGPRGWSLLDGQAVRCTQASDLDRAFTRLPDTFVASAGDTLRVRPQALVLAKTLEAAEPWFLESLWPRHEALLAAADDELEAGLVSREAACFRSVAAALNLGHPVLPLPVYLVVLAPPPGGETLRGPTGTVSVVGVSGLHGADLAEVVLHESIHALDVATAQEPTALQRLRQSLLEGGVPRTDPRYRDLPHALIFLQAAATVREVLDPDHRDYGETHGIYDRMQSAVDLVAPLWRARLEGKLPLEVALRRMVKEATGE